MSIVRAVIGLAVLAAAGLGVHDFFRGDPERDIVVAPGAGDLRAVERLLADDPALARAKVYPQAYERTLTAHSGPRAC
jgi:hypothetical protein